MRPPVTALALLLAGCSAEPAAPAAELFTPPLPPGVTLAYGGEHPPLPRLASACDSARMDQARAEALARDSIGVDLTAAERTAQARDLERRRYGVENQEYFWLVTREGPNQTRYRRGRLLLGLRPGVGASDLNEALRAVGAVQLRVPTDSSLPLGVDVAFGAERAAALVLLWDCRVRYVAFEAITLGGISR